MAGGVMTPRKQPIVLTVGGSDSSGQAGVQVDLRTFAAHEVHGVSALTALTIQNHERVLRSEVLSPGLLSQQIKSMIDAFPIRAIKTGMLASAAHIEVVAELLSSHSNAPLVVDPVLHASSGARLLDATGEKVLVEKLLPRATIFTPNIPEAIQLTQAQAQTSPQELAAVCASFIRTDGIVVIKGGHADQADRCRDVVRLPNGVLFHLDAPRIETSASRGTGCTFSAAIAANLSKGMAADESIRLAKTYITGAIRHGVNLRGGRGPVGQLWKYWSQEEAQGD